MKGDGRVIVKKLREILIKDIGIPQEKMLKLKDDDSLIGKEILNSLSTIKFLMQIEKTFNIKFSLNSIYKKEFSTLINIEKNIKKRMENK